MVMRHTYLIFLMVLYTTCGFAQSEQIARLEIVMDKTELEMGKSLSVRLVYIGGSIPQQAQIQSWKKDFFIEEGDVDTEHLPQGYIKTTRSLRLYPRRAGILTLHAVAQGGAIAKPVRVKVKPVIRHAIDGTPRWIKTPQRIWQGQTFLLGAEMNLMSNSNQVKTEEPRFAGFSLIKHWQTRVISDGVTKIQLYWLLRAHNYGYFSLDAPSIIQRGKGRWRFYMPTISLQVKPLPSYIPPTVPVAQLRVSSDIINRQSQLFWQVNIKSSGQLPEEIYGLKVNLAKLANTRVNNISLHSEQQITDRGVIFVQHYQVPVPQWLTAFNKPVLTMHSFNPRTGQLNKQLFILPVQWHIPKTWQFVFMILLFVTGVLLIYLMVRGIRRYRHKRAFFRAVLESQSSDQLRHLLLQNSGFKTLSQVAAKRVDSKLYQSLEHLNKICFSRDKEYSLSTIKKNIIKFYPVS